MNIRPSLLVLMATLIVAGCAPRPVVHQDEIVVVPRKTLSQRARDLKIAVADRKLGVFLPPNAALDTTIVDTTARTIVVRMNEKFAAMPFRDTLVNSMYAHVKEFLGPDASGYGLTIEALQKPIEELVPNLYRTAPAAIDRSRLPLSTESRPLPVKRNLSSRNSPTAGLQGKNVVLWPSHGWYYNEERDRWEWQRPRLFQAVEDLIPLSFVLPYITPMLENAGASVFIPRERDTQTHEVVLDNDGPAKRLSGKFAETSRDKRHAWRTSAQPGFAYGNPPYEGRINPFREGTSRRVESDTVVSATTTWIPAVPETGDYAVYISYAASDSNVNDAEYQVMHDGGSTTFRVNQQIGGGTWEYLGTFRFKQGSHPASGKVVLTNRSSRHGAFVSADAVRFGGGMGLVARHGQTGGRPKFVEGSRYYLQYAGMPDSLVYNMSRDRNDYRDDYQARPEYVNYLKGAPFGPNRNRNAKGLGIPIDVSLAFHTDAGITRGDSTVGTLSIYSIEDGDGRKAFPDSVSRFANRDLADILQSQIVGDIRAKYDPRWNRRDLRNADYSESTRPNVPSVLLELLSHQNFQDMKFVLDPRFRFDVSRAIYKALLRFLAGQDGITPVVQPLPVTHCQVLFSGEREITFRWQPALDPLEPTAVPKKYIVYTRENDRGFDNGTLVDQPRFTLRKITPGTTYSFKVTAINEGGESFPSEILSACRLNQKARTALIVNGFDRISGPANVEGGDFAGFLNLRDEGVADRVSLNFTGTQYDFSIASPFRSNDSPGHGASHADKEGTLQAGNSFDYPFTHGAALKTAGLSFVSASRAAVTDSLIDLSAFPMIDLILGEQKETPWQLPAMDSTRGVPYKVFPLLFRTRLQEYCQRGGNVFLTGAYIGTDVWGKAKLDSSEVRFARDVLKYIWLTDHAAVTGKVARTAPFFRDGFSLAYNVTPGLGTYVVEAPDAIGPVGGSKSILRYAENQFSAAVAFKQKYGVIAFGFPFETILNPETRGEVMKFVVKYFGF